MDAEVLKAYDSLVPADQLVIVAVIISLSKKDKEIHNLATAVSEGLGGADRPGG